MLQASFDAAGRRKSNRELRPTIVTPIPTQAKAEETVSLSHGASSGQRSEGSQPTELTYNPSKARFVSQRYRMATDFALLLPAFVVASILAPIDGVPAAVVALAAAAISTLVARQMGVYAVGATDSNAIARNRCAATLSVSAGIFLLVSYVTSVEHDRAWLPLAVGGAAGMMALHRLVLCRLAARPQVRPYLATRLALIGDASAIDEFDRLDSHDGPTLVAHRTYLDTYDDVRPALRKIDHVIDLAKNGEIDRVVMLAAAPGIPVVNAVVRRCSLRGVGVDLLTGATRVRPARLEIGHVNGFSTVHVRPGLHGRRRVATKRVFDLVVASVALIVFSPIMAVAAIAVKAGSAGPVFYTQRRLGRNGQQFEMIKFRTMVPEAEEMLIDLVDENEADGPLFKMADDPRITRVGGFMRRTSVDELPQLWNVVRGQMSLVGPRPALAIEADGWPVELFDRLEVSPGITGMWQVGGRSNASFADYERLDLYYVDNWTFGLDLSILIRTIPALLGRGAY